MLHGGEIYNSAEVRYDFSVNINPLGIPEGVLIRLRDSLPLLKQYPDRDCRSCFFARQPESQWDRFCAETEHRS